MREANVMEFNVIGVHERPTRHGEYLLRLLATSLEEEGDNGTEPSDSLMRNTISLIRDVITLFKEVYPGELPDEAIKREQIYDFIGTLTSRQLASFQETILSYRDDLFIEQSRREAVEHMRFHWTTCTDDFCAAHYNAKVDGGWFPRKRRHEFNVIEMGWNAPNLEIGVVTPYPDEQDRDDGYHARGRSPPPYVREDTPLPEDPEVPDSDKDEQDSAQTLEIPSTTQGSEEERTISVTNSDESTELEVLNSDDYEESSDEYSDDEAPGDNELMHFTVEGPQPVMDIVLHLSQRFEEIFPRIQGKRRLHAIEFERMIAQLRTMFWNYRQVNLDYEDWPYVQEIPPPGSKYMTTGGYIAPDGIYISPPMRKSVDLTQRRYREICRIQGAYQRDEISGEEMNKQCQETMRQWLKISKPKN